MTWEDRHVDLPPHYKAGKLYMTLEGGHVDLPLHYKAGELIWEELAPTMTLITVTVVTSKSANQTG